MKKFALFDGDKAEYQFFDDADIAINAAVEMAMGLLLRYTHNAGIVEVEVLEDGSKVWGDDVSKNEHDMREEVKRRLALKVANNIKVVTF